MNNFYVLKFSNDKYKKIAFNNYSKVDNIDKNIITREEAFLILIKDLDKKDLDVLLKIGAGVFNISMDDLYILIQDYNESLNKYVIYQGLEITLASALFKIASSIIYTNKNTLGTYVNEQGFNTSSWISHSFYVAEVTEKLSKSFNLNGEFAYCYGLLHDIGRKITHKFEHVTKGFEFLIDIGLESYAKACLTHSFMGQLKNGLSDIKGGRFACNEVIHEFSLDQDGNEHYPEKECDDVALALDNITYSLYDIALNIADDVATDNLVVTPVIRVNDIAHRREVNGITIDLLPNRIYFYKSFINLLLLAITNLSNNEEDVFVNKISNDLKESNDDLEIIKEIFQCVSDKYVEFYNKL